MEEPRRVVIVRQARHAGVPGQRPAARGSCRTRRRPARHKQGSGARWDSISGRAVSADRRDRSASAAAARNIGSIDAVLDQDPVSRLSVSSRACYTGAGACPPWTRVQIPNRSLFRQPEVCEIAQVQPYVLRSWEAEFPDLGVAKTAGDRGSTAGRTSSACCGIKHLLFVEGLTLAGARRKLQEEQPARADARCAGARRAAVARRARADPVRCVRRCASWPAMLAQKPGAGDAEFALAAPPVEKRAPRAAESRDARRRQAKRRRERSRQ